MSNNERPFTHSEQHLPMEDSHTIEETLAAKESFRCTSERAILIDGVFDATWKTALGHGDSDAGRARWNAYQNKHLS